MKNRISRDNKFTQGKISINQLKNPQKYVGKYKTDIEFLSSLENFYIKFCDENPGILGWSSEEIIIPYKHPVDGRMHRYFVDFYIRYKSKSGKIEESLIEIKPYKETLDKPYITEGMSNKSKKHAILNWNINQSKWKYAREYCKKRNMKFVILTEKELRG